MMIVWKGTFFFLPVRGVSLLVPVDGGLLIGGIDAVPLGRFRSFVEL